MIIKQKQLSRLTVNIRFWTVHDTILYDAAETYQ